MGEVLEERASAMWDRAGTPGISVGIATHGRAAFLPALARALEAQRVPPGSFEVVIVDDASSDDTWSVLEEIAASTALPLRVLRLGVNAGPAVARNVAAASSRAPAIAFTDDDCLPTPDWLPSFARALGDGADLVQGRVLPDPDGYDPALPWSRTLWVNRGNWLFESCNIAYRRASFDALGGFSVERPDVTRGTRSHFGEDTSLGWRLKAAGMRTEFSDDALVYHRVHPGSFGDWLVELRRRVMFPGLVRRSPGMHRALFAGVFLSRTTAAFDLAVAGVLTAAVRQEIWPLAGSVPWLWTRLRDARYRRGRPPLFRLAQLGVGDLVSLVSLLEGSARARRLVL
jgi:GT2 family glycosyltransferase